MELMSECWGEDLMTPGCLLVVSWEDGISFSETAEVWSR